MTPLPKSKIAAIPIDHQKPRKNRRHRLVIASFVLMFLLPFLAAIFYIFTRAVDQYHSHTAFSVRSEDFANPLDVLGAFTQTGSSTAADSEILNDYILSQTMVEIMASEFDLQAIFNRHPRDFVFSLNKADSIEDLVDYWGRMISVSVDSTSGVVDLETRAFSAEDAHLLADAINNLLV